MRFCHKQKSFLAAMLVALAMSLALGAPANTQNKTAAGFQSEEEHAVLQELFTLRQQMEEQERLLENIQLELEKLQEEILALEKSLERERSAFEENRELLKAVLRSYQRRGAASYLEILLSSTSLRSLLQRISSLRNLSRGVAALLSTLEENTLSLETQRKSLSEKLSAMEGQKRQLDGALAQNALLAGQLEQKLASLGSQRQYYEEQLASVERAWNEAKAYLSSATRELNRIVREGNLPEDAITTRIGFSGITGTIDEATLNGLLASHPEVSGMVFGFSPGTAALAVKDKNLLLIGTFKILSGHTLQFQAQEGYFLGLPLELSSLEELFAGNPLALNLETLLGDFKLRSVEILERSLLLEIAPKI